MILRMKKKMKKIKRITSSSWIALLRRPGVRLQQVGGDSNLLLLCHPRNLPIQCGRRKTNPPLELLMSWFFIAIYLLCTTRCTINFLHYNQLPGFIFLFPQMRQDIITRMDEERQTQRHFTIHKNLHRDENVL